MSSNVQEQVNDVPFLKSFAGHETFALRYSWLKKGIDLLADDPGLFRRDDAIVRLGVGKNMVRSIRHWCLATRMAREKEGSRGRKMEPTELGSSLFRDGGWDPYIEDDATAWLLHWNLASYGTRAATWYWAFNRFRDNIFTRVSLVDALRASLKELGWDDTSEMTLKRDVDCFMHTYVDRGSEHSADDAIDCPLAALGLIVKEPHGDRYRFVVGPKGSLPAEVFAYSLADFWNNALPERRTLELRQVVQAEGSPALVYRLDRNSVLGYLDRLAEVTHDAMVFEDTAQVRRVVKQDESPLQSSTILEAYYGSR